MKHFKQIGLFLSSFSPLFLLLIIKEIVEIFNKNWSVNFLNCFLLIFLSIMLFFGIFVLIKILKEVKSCEKNLIKVLSKKNTTDQHFLGYFSLFVLFAISFEIEMYSMAIVFVVVLSMIAIVYIKNDMYFINPLLNILGYSFYEIKYVDNNSKTKTSMVFYKGLIKENSNYCLCTKYSSLYFLV